MDTQKSQLFKNINNQITFINNVYLLRERIIQLEETRIEEDNKLAVCVMDFIHWGSRKQPMNTCSMLSQYTHLNIYKPSN